MIRVCAPSSQGGCRRGDDFCNPRVLWVFGRGFVFPFCRLLRTSIPSGPRYSVSHPADAKELRAEHGRSYNSCDQCLQLRFANGFGTEEAP